jgi:hypothetical protein
MLGDCPSQRDPRIDVLRGFALLTIFVDHVPGNILGMLTLRNFGFADAADLVPGLRALGSTRGPRPQCRFPGEPNASVAQLGKPKLRSKNSRTLKFSSHGFEPD